MLLGKGTCARGLTVDWSRNCWLYVKPQGHKGYDRVWWEQNEEGDDGNDDGKDGARVEARTDGMDEARDIKISWNEHGGRKTNEGGEQQPETKGP